MIKTSTIENIDYPIELFGKEKELAEAVKELEIKFGHRFTLSLNDFEAGSKFAFYSI